MQIITPARVRFSGSVFSAFTESLVCSSEPVLPVKVYTLIQSEKQVLTDQYYVSNEPPSRGVEHLYLMTDIGSLHTLVFATSDSLLMLTVTCLDLGSREYSSM